MDRVAAKEMLAKRYYEQCEQFPRTREIPLSLYLQRNLNDAIRNMQSRDERTVAERKWQQGKLAPVGQLPCDHGLFSDDAKQNELF